MKYPKGILPQKETKPFSPENKECWYMQTASAHPLVSVTVPFDGFHILSPTESWVGNTASSPSISVISAKVRQKKACPPHE